MRLIRSLLLIVILYGIITPSVALDSHEKIFFQDFLALNPAASTRFLSPGWNSSATESVCEWAGVICSVNQQNVIRLYLDGIRSNVGNNITLPASINKLTQLQELYLGQVLIGRLPDAVTQLSNLRILDLDRTNIAALPDNFGALSNLVRLELPAITSLPPSFRNLNSLIQINARTFNFRAMPTVLCEVRSLQVIRIIGGVLRDAFPACFAQLTELRELVIQSSQLSIFPVFLSWQKLELLTISYANLQGTIPDLLGSLPNLRELTLRSNSLTGSLPRSLGDMRSLVTLTVENNRLTGTIPSTIGNMTSLRMLVLASNQLTGTLPPEICNLTDLQFLDVSTNRLSGSFPEDIGRLTNLSTLSFTDNLFSGTIPPSIVNTSLRILNGGNNQLTGQIPEDIGRLPLRTFLLSNNQLTGTLPPSFENCTLMRDFNVAFNLITGSLFDFTKFELAVSLSFQFNLLNGTLPSEGYENLSRLDTISFQNNDVRGTIPPSLGAVNARIINLSSNWLVGPIPPLLLVNNTRLTLIDISDNVLSGTIPPIDLQNVLTLFFEGNLLSGSVPSTSHLNNLQYLDFSFNRLRGELPTFGTRLLYLALDHNEFEGTIPAELFELTNLGLLDLSFNSLNGTIPRLPNTQTTLRHLDLSNNKLTGELPQSLLNMVSIQNIILSNNLLSGVFPFTASLFNINIFRVDRNLLTGNFPRHFLAAVNLEVLDLSDNSLTGVIPSTADRPRRLKELSVARNRLTGAIPPTLSNILSLERLDLSGNLFLGGIPTQLGMLRRLQSIDFSDNDLIGTIPDSLEELTQLEILDLSYNDLEGTIPEFISNLFQLQVLNLYNNKFVGTIPNSIVNLRALVELYLGDNHLEGTVPRTLFSLQRAKGIDLSENYLVGTLPPTLSLMRTLEYLNLADNAFTGQVPSLQNLINLKEIYVQSNQFSGCIRLPQQFANSEIKNTTCVLENNNFCCADLTYNCRFSDGRCNINSILKVSSGNRVHIKDADSFTKLVVERGGTLIVTPSASMTLDCLDVQGSIDIEVTDDYEDKSFEMDLFTYTCGNTNNVTFIPGKGCRISQNRTISEISGSFRYELQLDCTLNYISQGTIIAIIVASCVAGVMAIVVGAVTYRYFRGKRRVKQLLNRVELLTLTTKTSDYSMLPQWHAPEHYVLKPIEDMPINVGGTRFDFSAKGNLLRIETQYKDVMKVQYKSKQLRKLARGPGLIERLLDKNISVKLHPVVSEKYQLAIDPSEIQVNEKDATDVTLLLQMKMTTKTNVSLWIEMPELKQFSLLEFTASSEPSPWVDIDEVDGITESLGEGGFGTVYKARYRGQTVAYKKLKFQELNVQQFEEFNREVAMMMNLHHKSIVQFIGASKVPGKLAILTEFIPGGNLQSLLNVKALDIGLKLKIALDIAEALKFLHTNNILHRDIKAENILVVTMNRDAAINVKLTDFGTARSVSEQVTMKFTKGIGTPTYMAPEILDNKTYEKAADVYSFGILLWVLITQEQPYSYVQQAWEVASYVISGKRLPIPSDTPVSVAELIKKCWAQQPEDRPTFDDVVSDLSVIVEISTSKLLSFY